MSYHKDIPTVCYKKLEDGTEIIIEKFSNLKSAKEWANKNSIMGFGSVMETIRTNKYLPKRNYSNPSYPNRHSYRFSYSDLEYIEAKKNAVLKPYKTAPIACYKKLEDGSEIIVEKFINQIEAIRWAEKNRIMCHPHLKETMRLNGYLPKKSRIAKYFNSHLYRFAYLDSNENENKQ